jgi:MFS family permease
MDRRSPIEIQRGTEPVVPPLLTRAFGLLVMAHFLQALAYASMLLLPLYLQHLGATNTVIGMVMATAAISGLLLRPAIGWALDSLGRKPTLVACTLLTVAAIWLLAFVDRIGPLIYIQRALLGIGLGGLFTAYFTFAADIIPPSRRTEGLALFGVSGLLPLLINPFSDQLELAPPDLRWFLPLVGVAVALSLLFIAPLDEPTKSMPQQPKLDARAAIDALRSRTLWPTWLATTAFSSLVAVFMTFATVTADARGVTQPASLWLSYALGAVTVRLFGGRLPDRIGPANMITPALGLYIVGAFLAAEAQSLRQFLVAALCAGIGHGYCFPVLTSQVVTRTPLAFRGSALAMFTALWGLSELAVSPSFGMIADRYGEMFMFWLAGTLGLAALSVWVACEHFLAPASTDSDAS